MIYKQLFVINVSRYIYHYLVSCFKCKNDVKHQQYGLFGTE